MKKHKILLTITTIACVLISCISFNKGSESETSIIGDWYLEGNTMVESFDYQEVYFDEDTYYVFLPSNYEVSYRKNYFFDGKRVYILDDTRQDTLNTYSIKKSKNGLKMKGEKGTISYIKIKDEKRLSELLSNQISKDSFDEAFTNRMLKYGDGSRFVPANKN
nr:hypothetical protein [Allomuricauda sp.]